MRRDPRPRETPTKGHQCEAEDKLQFLRWKLLRQQRSDDRADSTANQELSEDRAVQVAHRGANASSDEVQHEPEGKIRPDDSRRGELRQVHQRKRSERTGTRRRESNLESNGQRDEREPRLAVHAFARFEPEEIEGRDDHDRQANEDRDPVTLDAAQ